MPTFQSFPVFPWGVYLPVVEERPVKLVHSSGQSATQVIAVDAENQAGIVKYEPRCLCPECSKQELRVQTGTPPNDTWAKWETLPIAGRLKLASARIFFHGHGIKCVQRQARQTW
jgi:hypothetical protein